VRSAARRRIIGRVTTEALERIDLGEVPYAEANSLAEMAAASGRATPYEETVRSAVAEALGAG
jgi:hypothetical protein